MSNRVQLLVVILVIVVARRGLDAQQQNGNGSRSFRRTDTARADTTSSQPVTLNMTSLGADPSGINDSAAAIRAIIAVVGTQPLTLYFPKGTYRLASHGATSEECVRISSSISLLGDGPGKTTFTDDPVPACVGQFGFFWSIGTSSQDDYSFESDPGYPVNASSASSGSSAITLIRAGDAGHYTAGQYVYLRGARLPQPGEFHGELNIVTSVDSAAGTVTLTWPLSSDFTSDVGLQLNPVGNNEVLTNIQISGITFSFHDNAILAAQVLGLSIFNNEFLYQGVIRGNEANQFNQIRNAEFYNNMVKNPSGNSVDIERTSNNWDIHDNTLYGPFDAGEAGANMNFHNNTITCVNTSTNTCIRFGGTTGNIVDSNKMYESGSPAYGIIDVSGPVTSPKTVISNNQIVAASARAIVAQSQGTVISGNTIFSAGVGIDINADGVIANNNAVTLTVPSSVCVLVEGTGNRNSISGLNCAGFSAAYNKGVYVTALGPQAGPQLVITGVTGNNLLNGIYVLNPAVVPTITNCTFTNTIAPFYPLGIAQQ